MLDGEGNVSGRGSGRTPALRGGLSVALLAVAVVVGVALAGCDPHASDGVGVVNNTGQPLHFVLLMDDGPSTLPATADPHGTTLLLSPNSVGGDGCSPYAVVAYDPSGREVARHPAGKGLCLGDRWTIGSPGASPSE